MDTSILLIVCCYCISRHFCLHLMNKFLYEKKSAKTRSVENTLNYINNIYFFYDHTLLSFILPGTMLSTRKYMQRISLRYYFAYVSGQLSW